MNDMLPLANKKGIFLNTFVAESVAEQQKIHKGFLNLCDHVLIHTTEEENPQRNLAVMSKTHPSRCAKK